MRAWPQDKLPDLVIGADTVVDLEGIILEKPMDAADAEAMLCKLSGRRHAVHTGVALILPSSQGACKRSGYCSCGIGLPVSCYPQYSLRPQFDLFAGEDGEPCMRTFSSTTAVEFDELSSSEIRAYISTGTSLPPFMPPAICCMTALPLRVNGGIFVCSETSLQLMTGNHIQSVQVLSAHSSFQHAVPASSGKG